MRTAGTPAVAEEVVVEGDGEVIYKRVVSPFFYSKYGHDVMGNHNAELDDPMVGGF